MSPPEDKTLREIYEERKDLYEKFADLIIDVDEQSIEATAKELPRSAEARFTGPIVFCYTTQRTQGSTCRHGLRCECCDG